jgi:hypothetical protein
VSRVTGTLHPGGQYNFGHDSPFDARRARGRCVRRCFRVRRPRDRFLGVQHSNFRCVWSRHRQCGHIERYELAGAVSGIEAAASIDASTRPIHVHTDSDFVLAVLKHLAETAELPPRRSYDRVRDLIQRASTALGPRILSFSRCNGDSADHQRCHLAALSKIRWHIQNDILLGRELALKREEQKLMGLLRRRIQLEKQLQALDLELAISDTSLRAIREFWRCEALRDVQGEREAASPTCSEFPPT